MSASIGIKTFLTADFKPLLNTALSKSDCVTSGYSSLSIDIFEIEFLLIFNRLSH
jgi:hypothetical protein